MEEQELEWQGLMVFGCLGGEASVLRPEASLEILGPRSRGDRIGGERREKAVRLLNWMGDMKESPGKTNGKNEFFSLLNTAPSLPLSENEKNAEL